MTLNKKSLVIFFSFLTGFFSVQRFFLAEIYHIFPVIYVLLAVLFLCIKEKTYFTLFSLISLLTSIDNGGDIYNETPALVRYFSYLLCMIAFFKRTKKVSINRLIAYSAWLSLILILTLLNYENVVFQALLHNVIVLFFVFMVFVSKCIDDESILLVNSIILPLVMGIIVGECLNLLFYFDISLGYLNYNSTKSLIIFPLLYFLCKRNYFIVSILTPITFLIIIFYVTRMILISFFIVLFLIFSAYLVRNFSKSLTIFLFLILLGYQINNHVEISQSELSEYKITNMANIVALESHNGFSDILKRLDPVRYGELTVLTDAPLINILFGNGLGASYYDRKNTFDFVGKHDYAFSEKELQSKRFYNFHDIWSDLGFRIGLVPLALLFIWLIHQYWKLSVYNRKNSSIPLLCIVLIFCGFFSTAGIILIFIMLGSVYMQQIQPFQRYKC